MNNKVLIVVYTFLVVSALIYFSGYIQIKDECYFFTSRMINRLNFFVLWFFIPVIGFIVSVLIKMKKENRIFLWGGIPIIVIIITGISENHNEYKYIMDNATLVKKAFVQSSFVGKNSNSIEVKFRDSNYYYTKTISYKLNFRSENFSKGDSLLVIHVDGCPRLVQIFSPYPTPTEWDKCRECGYWLDGVLYSKEEYDSITSK
jgi:hypothetical protein